jgi:formylglycine-generating enzyme required for sulfatase activity
VGAVGALGAACASLSGLADGEPRGGDGGSPAGDAASLEGPLADVVADGAGGEDAGAEVGPDACPGRAGPPGIRVGAYCIDSTEVTNAQYQTFVLALDGGAPAQPPECARNASLLPNYGWPPGVGEGALPVVGVDWCDARAFCAWAGKRLCGRIGGGGTLRYDEGNDPARDQWYRACSANGAHLYPYGDAYQAATCNGTSNLRAPVGSFASCVGGYPGLYDMSGNVMEWEDLCDPDPDGGGHASDACRVRGGGSNDSPAVLACTSTFSPRRDYAVAPIGFRCCSE